MSSNGELIDGLEKRFLLGELLEDERLELEEGLLLDGELFDRVRAIEHELTDAYASGELPPAEAKRFAERYLATPEGRRKVDLALALRAAGALKPTAAVPDNVRRFPRRTAWLAMAAGLATLVVGLWLLSEGPQPGGGPPRVAGGAGTEAPIVATAVLSLTRIRAEEEPQAVEVPADADRIEIVLDLEGVAAEAPFTVEIRNFAGAMVWEDADMNPLENDWGQSLVVEIPTPRLPAAEYELRIRGHATGDEPDGAVVRFVVGDP